MMKMMKFKASFYIILIIFYTLIPFGSSAHTALFNYRRLFENTEYRKFALERINEISKQCLPRDLYYTRLSSDTVKEYLIQSIEKLKDDELRQYFNEFLVPDTDLPKDPLNTLKKIFTNESVMKTLNLGRKYLYTLINNPNIPNDDDSTNLRSMIIDQMEHSSCPNEQCFIENQDIVTAVSFTIKMGLGMMYVASLYGQTKSLFDGVESGTSIHSRVFIHFLFLLHQISVGAALSIVLLILNQETNIETFSDVLFTSAIPGGILLTTDIVASFFNYLGELTIQNIENKEKMEKRFRLLKTPFPPNHEIVEYAV